MLKDYRVNGNRKRDDSSNCKWRTNLLTNRTISLLDMDVVMVDLKARQKQKSSNSTWHLYTLNLRRIFNF